MNKIIESEVNLLDKIIQLNGIRRVGNVQNAGENEAYFIVCMDTREEIRISNYNLMEAKTKYRDYDDRYKDTTLESLRGNLDDKWTEYREALIRIV